MTKWPCLEAKNDFYLNSQVFSFTIYFIILLKKKNYMQGHTGACRQSSKYVAFGSIHPTRILIIDK